ncbi:Fc.00g010010.m01.CDS01 [Cosmosporella sp. VM-42]
MHKQSPPKQHLHNPTGITDEVGVEAHDLIHNAEMEEQKMHGKDAMCADDPGPKSGLGSESKDSKGPMEKVKDALHLNK